MFIKVYRGDSSVQPGQKSLSLKNQVCIFEEGGIYCNLEGYISLSTEICTSRDFTRKQNL